MTGAGWWTNFFEGAALELWRRAHSPEESRARAGDFARALRLAPGEHVLDVPCGDGRLALELAARGAHVTGLDASTELVNAARRRAAERGLELELATGDMRALAWRAEFDAALCAGSSFGYFDSPGDDEFLAGVARALRRGGRFWLEYPLVAELVLARREFRDWRVFGERVMLSEARYDERRARLETRYSFGDLAGASGALETRTASYRVYTARELADRLETAGFTGIELFADVEGTPFDRTAGEFHVRAVRA